MTIKERIFALRQAMKEAGIAAWIVPGTDPHMNEYLPKHWSERAFISGFSGSAGKVLITQDMAGLWTDGRYFIQANEQLQEGGLELFKEGVAGTPSITQFLTQTLKSGDKVGMNGLIVQENLLNAYQNDFAKRSIKLISDVDLIAKVWNDRPPLLNEPAFLLDAKVSGEKTSDKLTRLRQAMGDNDAYLVNMLDEIAWLFNVRGADVQCNPIVMAYAWVEKSSAILFIDENKLSEEDIISLEADGVSLLPYSSVLDVLPELSEEKKVQGDLNKLNHALIAVMSKAEIQHVDSWIMAAKACKNKIEVEGTRKAMIKDGVALTQFFMWLEKALAENPLNEYEIGLQLDAFRAKQEDYVGESFNPIVGYASNGAITHYSAPKEGSSKVTREGILLLDSGGQYKHGTTDITRTIAVGSVTEEMKQDFTLVLKGHINLACAKFPQGTRGSQLDALARIALWNEAKDYQHGTGHGVGHFLNVHEGPQNIRKEENLTPLKEGMIISNEPGFYVEGKYGIRIENLVAVEAFNDSFNQFETLTLFPIDQKLIDPILLSSQEKEWLNSYHCKVYEKLSSRLSKEEKDWLKEKTMPILL